MQRRQGIRCRPRQRVVLAVIRRTCDDTGGAFAVHRELCRESRRKAEAPQTAGIWVQHLRADIRQWRRRGDSRQDGGLRQSNGRDIGHTARHDARGQGAPWLHVPGVRYRKSGVVFFGLEKAGSAMQQDLFSAPKTLVASKLYEAVDRINAKFGSGKVFSAAEGMGERSWEMRREKLSLRASTRWDELMAVK